MMLSMISQPRAGWHKSCLSSNDAIVYYSNSLPINKLDSFKQALNPSVWREYLQPFACAIVNESSHEVVLVRDHLGLEPLYYYYQTGIKLIFAQSIPEILQQLSRTPPLCKNQIHMLFAENKTYSDETFYQDIYRVEPGHLLHFKADGTMMKKAFWQLSPHGAMLQYADDRDYVEHFTTLMNEAIVNAVGDQTNIAAEFSAGLDSSAVYCATANNNICRPSLFMHVARPETISMSRYNDSYEKAFMAHYQLTDIHRIGADDFDPIQVFNKYAAWFAGPAPYLFSMFANPVHRAVAAGKHPILLSGFGGDQCVSNQVPLNFFLPELIHCGDYRQAWRELTQPNWIKKTLQYAKYAHPRLYAQALKMKLLKRHVTNVLRPKAAYQPTMLHPYERMCYPSVRAAECALLQGPESHEVRMRIEYSSIVSKKMGFEYRYPLLFPKLLEFMVSLPTIQKRRDGRGRYLIRQYLSKFIPGDLFSTYRKQDGLGIVPSTFDMFQKNFEQGCYQEAFKDMPYSHLIRHAHKPIAIRNNIKGFMLKAFDQSDSAKINI